MTGNARASAKPGQRRWRRLLGVGAALLFLAALYFAILLRPQILFSWVHDGEAIHVRSDEPIPAGAARVIALAEARIRRSTIFDARGPIPSSSATPAGDGTTSAASTVVPVVSRRRWAERRLLGGRAGRQTISRVPTVGMDLVLSTCTSPTSSRT